MEHIENHETLYRIVKRKKGYVKLENGEWRPSSMAFTDPYPRCRISVHRATKCNHDPASVKKDEDDFVCGVTAHAARNIDTVVKKKPSGEVIQRHEIHAEYTPLENDQTHAEIRAAPYFATKSIFRKLQERLALIASWQDGYSPEENFSLPDD